MTSFFLCFLPAEIAVDLVVSLWVQTELLPAVWAGEGHQNRLIVHFPGITIISTVKVPSYSTVKVPVKCVLGIRSSLTDKGFPVILFSRSGN